MTSSLTNIKTLTHFLLSHTPKGKLQSDLAILFGEIQLAIKVIANAVRRAALENLLGLAGVQNIHTEDVKKLDLIANDAFIAALKNSGRVCLMCSEEEAKPVYVEEENAGDYIVTFDPLDGSSNIDANVSIGSIFGIYPTLGRDQLTEEDLLQPGRNMVASGYALYGAATMLVLTMGEGVFGFTLDNSLGEFVLTHPDIVLKPKGSIYSVNEGNSKFWDEPVRDYVDSIKNPKGENVKPYSLRYIGSMVSDVHRTLLYGGIFMYPGDSRAVNGKLRYLYEVGPLSFLIEQAGGKSINGLEIALDVVPTEIHMRIPCFMGSTEDVNCVQEFFQNAQQRNNNNNNNNHKNQKSLL